MSKIELRPKREPCPEGTWQMICFKEEIATYEGKKGPFQRQIFNFQVFEGDDKTAGPGMMDWIEDDGSVRKIRPGARASLPVPKALNPATDLWKFLDGAFGPSWHKHIEELDDISTGKKTRVLDTSFMVGKRFTGKVIHNERGFAEVAEISAPDQDATFEFINYFDEKKTDKDDLPF